jgi:predicted transcriptional regulator
MEQEIKLDPQLQAQLTQAAREQRRSPARLLQEVVREYLDIYEDEKLFRQMQREAQQSGYREEDAVDLVRQARREMREQHGAS